jgi:hypothetical protein
MDQFELFKKNLSHANTYVKAISKSSLEVLWDIRAGRACLMQSLHKCPLFRHRPQR